MPASGYLAPSSGSHRYSTHMHKLTCRHTHMQTHTYIHTIIIENKNQNRKRECSHEVITLKPDSPLSERGGDKVATVLTRGLTDKLTRERWEDSYRHEVACASFIT